MMTPLHRRRLLQGMGGVIALAALPRIGHAEHFPARSVRIIVPFAPGGPTDVFARLLAQNLSERLGQQFFIENVPGAGGNIGTGRAAKAPPDGYTLVLTANNHVINPILYESVPYDPFKDFEPVSLAVDFATAFSVNLAVPAHSVSELVALVRATPGKYSFSSSGVGTPSHLLGEQFRQKLNLDMVHVPYNGSSPATAAVLAGDTQIGFSGLSAAAPLAQSGQLRVLAVMSATRSKALPDVPTIIEAGYPGLDGEAWIGIFAPAGTAPDIIALLSNEIDKAISTPNVAERIEALGFTPVGAPPDVFARELTTEAEKWGRVIRAAGLKVK